MYPAMSTQSCSIFYFVPLESSLLPGWLVVTSGGAVCVWWIFFAWPPQCLAGPQRRHLAKVLHMVLPRDSHYVTQTSSIEHIEHPVCPVSCPPRLTGKMADKMTTDVYRNIFVLLLIFFLLLHWTQMSIYVYMSQSHFSQSVMASAAVSASVIFNPATSKNKWCTSMIMLLE